MYPDFEKTIKKLFPGALTNCKILRKPDQSLNWDRIAHKLLEGWGHTFTRAVYDVNSDWQNFIWRN